MFIYSSNLVLCNDDLRLFLFYVLGDKRKRIYGFIRFVDRITFLKDSFLQIICFFCATLPKEAKVFGNPIIEHIETR